LTREGNRIVEVHVIPFQDAAGQWLVSEFNIDITERKQAEERLRASEVSYRELFNASNEAVFVHDAATGAIVDVNQTMCGMYGFSYQEALQLRIEDISEGLPPYSQYEAIEVVRGPCAMGRRSSSGILAARTASYSGRRCGFDTA
jgi:PAS domain-containing protein